LVESKYLRVTAQNDRGYKIRSVELVKKLNLVTAKFSDISVDRMFSQIPN
jgi:hypothetical protein